MRCETILAMTEPALYEAGPADRRWGRGRGTMDAGENGEFGFHGIFHTVEPNALIALALALEPLDEPTDELAPISLASAKEGRTPAELKGVSGPLHLYTARRHP